MLLGVHVRFHSTQISRLKLKVIESAKPVLFQSATFHCILRLSLPLPSSSSPCQSHRNFFVSWSVVRMRKLTVSALWQCYVIHIKLQTALYIATKYIYYYLRHRTKTWQEKLSYYIPFGSNGSRTIKDWSRPRLLLDITKLLMEFVGIKKSRCYSSDGRK